MEGKVHVISSAEEGVLVVHEDGTMELLDVSLLDKSVKLKEIRTGDTLVLIPKAA